MTSSADFGNRVALVTGGARGIGLAYARALARHGATVIIGDVRAQMAEQEAERLRADGLDITAVELDVSSESSVAAAFQMLEERFRRLDFLINNAAIMLDLEKPFKPFWETTWQEWGQVMNVNAGGVFLTSKFAKPLMERQGGGRIVNISSDGIWKGYDLQLAYFASKGAVAVMTRCLARELGPFGVNVNAVAPGFTLSGAVLNSEFMRSAKAAVDAGCALRRDQYPEDLVGTIVFLCSESSACITGQTIVVNRGSIMV
jgi:NAD(P)-dependent dehydrogenase (short-subunit alcohol dehydrogenase family)